MVLYRTPSHDAVDWQGSWVFGIATEYEEAFESEEECKATGAFFKKKLTETMLVPKRYTCIPFDAGLPVGAPR